MHSFVFICECSTGLENLAQATVTSFPTDIVASAEVTEIPKVGPSLPAHTAPGPDFGKQVGLLVLKP